jgi:hypothetical protein
LRTRLPQARKVVRTLNASLASSSRAPVPQPAPPDPDRDLERARRFGHRFEAPLAADRPLLEDGEPPSAAPIQHNGNRRRKLNLIDWRPDIRASTHETIATPNVSTGRKVLSGVSALGSTARFGSRVAEFARASNVPGALVPGLGLAASPIGAVSSLIEGGETLHRAATGGEKGGDKALLGLEATSSLANATVSGASTASYAGTLLGSSAIPAAAASVAGPAALVMGGADLVGGAVRNRLAARRQRKLAAIEENTEGFESGVARFAKDSQQTRKTSGLGSVLKGGLAIGGGIALLAGAGPIGWGLLGGAALVGGGLSLYKQYRKHKLGKQILNDPEYQQKLTAGNRIRIPDEQDLANESWTRRWNPFNTKESRTHDLIRGQIAQQLEGEINRPFHDDRQNDDAANVPLAATVGLLGLRNKGKKARATDIARALEG